MKINIYCRFAIKKSKLVWSGELACQFVPRIGESIVIKHGYPSEIIKDIVYAPNFEWVNVHITSDYANMYEEIKPLT